MMDTNSTNKPKVDIKSFILEIFNKALISSTPRIVITLSILFLRFMAVPLFLQLTWHKNTDSYYGLKEKASYESLMRFYALIGEFVLFIVLVIKSPRESTSKRKFAKYILLILLIYIWFVSEIVVDIASVDEKNKGELSIKSFAENSHPVYGKIVFASYMREKRSIHNNRSTIPFADTLSPETSGIIVIVQMDTAGNQLQGIENNLANYNSFSKLDEDSNNIATINPDIPNCLKFVIMFSGSIKSYPTLPQIGKFVKFKYDPIENGIGISTNINNTGMAFLSMDRQGFDQWIANDSTTVVLPTYDSIQATNSKSLGPNL